MKRPSDETFMKAALAEARKALGRTSPNPAVGAVLVSKGKVIARASHAGPGLPHAEVACFALHPGRMPADATLYVTLEPCCSSGRTPPCTTAIARSGVRHVVFGCLDPNPVHHGKATAFLAAAGITVRSGILANECMALNPEFNKWVTTGLPFVILKCGMGLDGRLTRPGGEPRWLTSAASRLHTQRLRAGVDAILIGAETLRRDDPRLTVRGVSGARQPWRIVLTRSGKLPRSAHVFTDRVADRTLVFRKKSLRAVLKELGKRKITSVLIEGGGEILGQALDQKLADKVQVYLAPLFTGGPTFAFKGNGAAVTVDGTRLHGITYERIGSDLCVTGLTRLPEKQDSK